MWCFGGVVIDIDRRIVTASKQAVARLSVGGGVHIRNDVLHPVVGKARVVAKFGHEDHAIGLVLQLALPCGYRRETYV